MNIKKYTCVLVGIILIFLLCACSEKENLTPSPSSTNQQPLEDNSSIPDDGDDDLPDSSLSPTPAESEIEKSLVAYREEREKTTGVKLGDGLSGYGAPNKEDYGLDGDGADVSLGLDSRELNEAYEAAKKYVVETLEIKVETNATIYPCVDPRINAIYGDEDKGVANGYEADNIFVCEYNDNGTWNYLILVRDAKGKPWEVIHHGTSYQND
jgi:hypothetical protein